ncbi:MAG TPA: hypothetical protein VGJ30_05110 [Candidatus Angelobacter sp.]
MIEYANAVERELMSTSLTLASIAWLVFWVPKLLLVGPAGNIQEPHVIRGSGYEIKVLHVTVMQNESSTNPVRLVEYQYAFDGRSSIYIRGIGDVPAKGNLAYFVAESDIEFRESPQGKIVATIPLHDEMVFGGPSTVRFPNDADFPHSVREGMWAKPSNLFHASITKILVKYFPEGIDAEERDGIDYYKTQFQHLDVLDDPNLKGEIAVLISHPFSLRDGKFYFHLQFTARESRAKSPTFHDPGSSLIKVAEQFVNKLMAELENAGAKSE